MQPFESGAIVNRWLKEDQPNWEIVWCTQRMMDVRAERAEERHRRALKMPSGPCGARIHQNGLVKSCRRYNGHAGGHDFGAY